MDSRDIEPLHETGSQTIDHDFDRLFRLSYRAAYRILASREDAEDVAMEALARASARWNTLRNDPSGWVTTVSVNLALDEWRRRNRSRVHRARVGTGSDTDTEGDPNVARRIDMVRSLQRLSARQRRAVVLRYFADLTEAQTAAAMGISIGSVKQHTARAFDHLRSDLEA